MQTTYSSENPAWGGVGGANLIRDINIKMSQSNRASGGEFEIFALLRCYSK